MSEFCIPFTKDKEYPFYMESIGFSKCAPDYRVTRTDAPHYVFEYVISGKGYIQNDHNPPIMVKGNDLFILPAGHNHLLYADKDDPYVKLWISCSGMFVSNTLLSYNLSNVIHIPNADVKSYFYKIHNICNSAKEKSEIFNRSAGVFLEMIQKLHMGEMVKTTKKKSANIAQRAKNIIDGSIATAISLDEIAQAIYCSKPHLIDSFKREYGVTPHQYIISQKVLLAQQYLLNAPLSINEISAQLGFGDSHYFSYFFKKNTGIAPSDFRDMNISK